MLRSISVAIFSHIYRASTNNEFTRRDDYEDDGADDPFLLWKQSWEDVKHFIDTLDMNPRALVKTSMKEDVELHEEKIASGGCSNELYERLLKVRARSRHVSRSSATRMYLIKDQETLRLDPLLLKTQMDVRWLSLYEACKRDHELQHSLARLYSVESPLYLGTSDAKQKRRVLKLEPGCEDFAIVGEFLGTAFAKHLYCFSLIAPYFFSSTC